MSKHSRFVLLSGGLLFMLLVSLACPVTVSAEDGTPPPPATEESIQPSAEGEVEVVEAATEAPVVEEAAVAEEPEAVATEEPVATEEVEAAATEVPVAESLSLIADGEEVTVGEVFAAAPEDTKIVVLDESGEALPLVSAKAVEIVASIDPIWCPGNQIPTPLLNGCTDSYNTVTDLIANLGGKNGAGTIYFTSTYSPAIPDATFDHTNANLANLTDLTIQGGWNGSTGTAYALSGVSTFNAPLWITNWNGNVTLNDLVLGSVPGMASLVAQTSGEIELNDVEASNNTFGRGASLTADGDIRIANSTFNYSSDGLNATSQNGSITLNGVDASNNTMNNGASLTASGDIQVTSSTFDHNSVMGLSASSTNGSITLNDVEASYNTSAMLPSQGASLSAGGDIQVTSSTFDYNGLVGGLNASSANGSITLNEVKASHNVGSIFGATAGNGASLGAGGDIQVTSGTFEGNAGAGLFVPSTNGSITLNEVIAGENGISGAIIVAGGYVEITDSAFDKNLGTQNMGGGLLALSHNDAIRLERVIANDNNARGLYVKVSGDISLVDVTANGNVYDGAYLESSSGRVSIISSYFDGNTSQGDEAGLYIDTTGDVLLSSVTAINNRAGDGAEISNFSSLTIQDSVFNDNYSEATDGDFGYGWGLFARGEGDVTLTDVTASGNGNPEYHAGGAYVWTFGNISIDPSVFNDNVDGEGLSLMSMEGDIDLTDVTANNNGWEGAYLSGGNATIVCSQFNENDSYGISAFVDSLTLDDVTFNGNGAGDYDYYQGTPDILSGGCKVVVNPENPIVQGSGTDVPGANDKGTKRALPLHIVPVGGGEQIHLDCRSYSGSKLILPNSDQVTLPCPIHDHGVLTGKTATQLPAPLNAPWSFASALDVQVIRNGEAVSRVNAAMIVDFMIPDGMQGKDFAILRWDAEKSQWVEMPGGTKTGDGRFMATSTFTGIYVLVTK